MENEKFLPVYTEKRPEKFSLYLFTDDEDYETQVMRESETFFEKYGKYPNGLVMNHETFERWYNGAATTVNNDLQESENITNDYSEDFICAFKESHIPGGTNFATPKYEMLIIYNSKYQDKVFELFYTDSYCPDKEEFSYPIIDMVETGKMIKQLADKEHISVQEIQDVCGLSSFQAVYKWLNGENIPTVEKLEKLAILFKTDIDDILVFKDRESL